MVHNTTEKNPRLTWMCGCGFKGSRLHVERHQTKKRFRLGHLTRKRVPVREDAR